MHRGEGKKKRMLYLPLKADKKEGGQESGTQVRGKRSVLWSEKVGEFRRGDFCGRVQHGGYPMRGLLRGYYEGNISSEYGRRAAVVRERDVLVEQKERKIRIEGGFYQRLSR